MELAGQKFGRLLVLRVAPKNGAGAHMRWVCQCDCGAATVASGTRLVTGRKQSCGCLPVEILVEHNTRHGMAHTRLYRQWAKMLRRCRNKDDKSYSSYGGRGICVCERWLDFANFLADMPERPSQRHSLGRIDNDKGYSPDNVRWETPQQQQRNRRSNRVITHDGRTMTAVEWAIELGIKPNAFYSRLNNMGEQRAIEFRRTTSASKLEVVSNGAA